MPAADSRQWCVWMWLGAGLLTLLLLSACRTALRPELSPAVVAGGDLPAAGDLPLGAEYLLCKWYVASYAELASPADLFTVRQRLVAAEAELFGTWRAGLADRYAPAIATQGEHRLALQPGGLRGLGSPASIRAVLAALRDEVRRGIPVDASADAATLALAGTAHRRAFGTWLADAPRSLRPPPEFDAAGLDAAIHEALLAADRQARIMAAMAEADRLLRDGRAKQAMDTLTLALGPRPAEMDLAPVGDRETVPAAVAQLQGIPGAVVLQACRAIDGRELAAARRCLAADPGSEVRLNQCAKHVAAAERALADHLRDWQDDSRLREALAVHESTVVALIHLLAKARGRVWALELEQAANRERFLEALALAEGFLEDAGGFAQEGFEVYRYADSHRQSHDPLAVTCLGIIQDEMSVQIAPFATTVCRELLGLAEREADIGLRHGTAVALCAVLQRLRAVHRAQALSPEMAELDRRVQSRFERSIAYLRRQVLPRSIAVEEFTAASPGLGQTWTRDVEGMLREALQSSPTLGAVALAAPDQEERPQDYRLTAGHVAEFRADEPRESESVRSVLVWGPITTRPPGTEPAGVAQNELEYAVRTRRIERVAHVRADADLLHAGERNPLRINEFLRREFVVEAYHPFNDVRIRRTVTGATPADLHPPGEPPAVREDRVWTAGEMLDWARREAQRLTVLLLLNEMDRHVLDLQARALALSRRGAVDEAAEAWGICWEAVRGLPPTPAALLSPPPAAEGASAAMRAAVAERARLDRELLDLRQEIGGALLDAVRALVGWHRDRRSEAP